MSKRTTTAEIVTALQSVVGTYLEAGATGREIYTALIYMVTSAAVKIIGKEKAKAMLADAVEAVNV